MAGEWDYVRSATSRRGHRTATFTASSTGRRGASSSSIERTVACHVERRSVRGRRLLSGGPGVPP